jgi:hypothetical protein
MVRGARNEDREFKRDRSIPSARQHSFQAKLQCRVITITGKRLFNHLVREGFALAVKQLFRWPAAFPLVPG